MPPFLSSESTEARIFWDGGAGGAVFWFGGGAGNAGATGAAGVAERDGDAEGVAPLTGWTGTSGGSGGGTCRGEGSCAAGDFDESAFAGAAPFAAVDSLGADLAAETVGFSMA